MAIQYALESASPIGPLYLLIPETDTIITNHIANKRFNEIDFAVNVTGFSHPDDYVFVMKFSAKNNTRGQFSVNGVQIFDSETHGNGDARITTVWGLVSSMYTKSGKVQFNLKGSGSTWVGEDATIYLVRARG